MFEIILFVLLIVNIFISIVILKSNFYSIVKTGNYEDFLKFDFGKFLKLQKNNMKKGSR